MKIVREKLLFALPTSRFCMSIPYFVADITYAAGTIRQLTSRANITGKSTYGYYFNEPFKPNPPNSLWSMQEWLKTSADHGDDLPFLFGAAWLRTGLETGQIWRG